MLLLMLLSMFLFGSVVRPFSLVIVRLSLLESKYFNLELITRTARCHIRGVAIDLRRHIKIVFTHYLPNDQEYDAIRPHRVPLFDWCGMPLMPHFLACKYIYMCKYAEQCFLIWCSLSSFNFLFSFISTPVILAAWQLNLHLGADIVFVGFDGNWQLEFYFDFNLITISVVITFFGIFSNETECRNLYFRVDSCGNCGLLVGIAIKYH